MEISNNIKINNSLVSKVDVKQTKQPQVFGSNMQQLPSVHTNGISQLNANLPVSYSKICDIPIPGIKEKASVFKLSNGQKVAILPKKGPTQIKTTFYVGSMNETDDIRGISHYIEHNLFNGSKGLAPREYDKKISDMGGYTNASTCFNKTDYYMNIQLLDDNFLEEGIKLNAAQTQYPTFPVEQLEKEKEAVKSEIDLYKDDTSDVAISTMLKNLFGVKTKATNFIIGTKQNINSFNREKVLDYYNTWYTPDNATTVITGDVDVNETIALVSKYFNKKPDASKIQNRYYETLIPIQQPVRQDFVKKGAQLANISMGFTVPDNLSDKENEALSLLVQLVENSNSSLAKALDKYGIYPYFSVENMQNKPHGTSAIYTSISLPEEQVEEVIKILYEEITKLANTPPTDEELSTIKKNMFENFYSADKSSGTLNSVLTSIVMDGEYNAFYETQELVKTITPKDIQDVAKKILDLNKVSLCVAHSENTTLDDINKNYISAYNKTSQVSFGKSNPVANIQSDLSKIKEYKLWNNIETAIIPSSSMSDSSMKIDIQTDIIKDVPAPVVSILSSILNRGSAIKNNEEYNKQLNNNNVGIAFDVYTDGITVVSAFKPEKVQTVMDLVKETLSMPNFSQEEFDRAKSNLKDSLANSMASATSLYTKELFGDTRYFDTTSEQLEQLEKVTLSDVQNLYNRILSNSQCEVTVNLPVEEKPYLQNVLHNSLSTGMPVFQNAVIDRALKEETYKPIIQAKTLTEAEENAQAEIIQAYTFKNTGNVQDEVKFNLLNIILGKGMSSRLFTDLREKEKLAYSVGSSLSSKGNTGIMELYISTTTDPETVGEGSPENARKAIAGFNRNVELLKTQFISEQELQQAKNKLKSDVLNERELASDTVCQMHDYRNSVYGFNHIKEFYEAIDKVTVEDIQATANYVFANPCITSMVASQKTLDELKL